MTEVNYALLKKGGFMRQRQKDNFALRLKIIAGRVRADQLPKLAEVAEKYGKGYVHLTTRQGVEIPFIQLKDIDAVKDELAKVGLTPGVCGPRVRTVIACQGDILCPYGLVNVEEIGIKADQRYYGKELPHKFKFAFSGCINSCAKPQENDFGSIGVVEPGWDGANCSQCHLCEGVCSSQAITFDSMERLQYDPAKCNLCGDCIRVCPTDCWKAKQVGHTVFVGGRIGRHPELGRELVVMVDDERLFALMDKTLDFYIKYGNRGERFGSTINRLGWDKFKSEVL
ncbi:MAG: 4Fe-4S binding protein [Candidatus Schekmanbacteria bacterium]|nr:4Fe-4S binding protein [Candidatus Schekmanbacteria bacterium]